LAEEIKEAVEGLVEEVKEAPTLAQRVASGAARAKEIAIAAKERLTESKEALKSIGVGVHKAGEKTGKYIARTSVYKGAQLGYQESKEKFKAGIREGTYATGKSIGRIPLTAAEYGVGKAKAFQTDIRTASKKGWHAGLLQRPIPGQFKPQVKITGFGLGGRYQFRPKTGSTSTRFKIPPGTIPRYHSKKLRSLLRTLVRKEGIEQGLAHGYKVAQELGWKTQAPKRFKGKR